LTSSCATKSGGEKSSGGESDPLKKEKSNNKKTVTEFNEIANWLLSTRHILHKSDHAERHLKAFLKYFVITQDEHDKINPFKSIPYDDMPHIPFIASIYIYERLICIAKSRQLMLTWLWCAILLWDAMFFKGRLNIVVNKKEPDADATIERMRFIYKMLPSIIKTAIPADKTPQGQLGAYCKLTFSKNDSMIKGLPQNPDAIRQNTASNLLVDEAAFIERFSECYTAALPTIRGGGRIIINSTPKGQNFFCKIYNDLGEENI